NDVNPYLVEEGFENSGWTGLTGYAQNELYSGSYSGMIDNPNTFVKNAEMDEWIDIDITEPTQYTFSVWVHSNGPSYRLSLKMKDADETGYATVISDVSGSTIDAWIKIQKTITVSPDIKKISLRVRNNGNSATTRNTVWFDNA
ncbi:hypothetical protein GWA97_13820, partial [Flavobacterium sp. LaA7.5]|nr:hypothetical protein [Flavobacterium salilacus subsp. altitudinum]